MNIKEKIDAFKKEHPDLNVKKILRISGGIIIVTTMGILCIRNTKLRSDNMDLRDLVDGLQKERGFSGVSTEELNTLKVMYGDVRELENAALGIAAKGLNADPTISKAADYEKTVLERLKK